MSDRPLPGNLFDVRRFGATGEGSKKDTTAIQRAVDACHDAGGGVVYLPPGTYLSGTIVLKSRVRLHLEAGATLLASPERGDYPAQDITVPDAQVEMFRHQLLWARGAEQIAITGAGTIDGQGHAFFAPSPNPDKRPHHVVRDWRPGGLIRFLDCRDILIRDVRLIGSPCYTVHPIACDRVRVQGIEIHNDRWGPNTDGINPDGCRNVHISDCTLHTGDDCIALKSHSALMPEPRPCENVTVTNCTMTTTCCGVRLGYEGDTPIRNCVFSNLVMYDMQTGIDLLVPRHESMDIHHGPLIENVTFNNIVFEGRKLMFLWIGDHEGGPAGIRRVNISNVIATTEHPCYIAGGLHIPIEDITVRGLELTVWGEAKADYLDNVPQPTSCWGCPGIPHAFYLRDARGIRLEDIRIRWGERSGPWRSAVRAERVRDLVVRGLDAGPAPESDAPTLHFTDVEDAWLHGYHADSPSRTWLHVDGPRSARIHTAAS